MNRERLFSLRMATAVLLIGASIAAVVRGANASFLGRTVCVVGAGASLAVALAVLRERRWAWGAASLLGICWAWVVVALRVRNFLDVGEVVMWLAWSMSVIAASLRGRSL